MVTKPGAPAYLAIDGVDHEIAFVNPGSPVISSSGSDSAVVWIVDENAPRTASLVGCDVPGPVLYAGEAATLRLLYRSGAGVLHVGGKYVTPVVAHGTVFVGTDRIQAFGLIAP